MKTFSRTTGSPIERTVLSVHSIECSRHWFTLDITIKSHRWSVLNKRLTLLHLCSPESQDPRADRAGSEETYILAFRWLAHCTVSSFTQRGGKEEGGGRVILYQYLPLYLSLCLSVCLYTYYLSREGMILFYDSCSSLKYYSCVHKYLSYSRHVMVREQLVEISSLLPP